MVKLKSDWLTEIIGSIKGSRTFKTYADKRGIVLEDKPVPTYTRSELQNEVRNNFSTYCEQWNGLTDAEKEEYQDLAYEKNLTPFQAFMSTKLGPVGVFSRPVISENLEVLYTMENIEGGTLIDEMGNYNGSLESPSQTIGYYDKGLSFNGASDLVNCGTSLSSSWDGSMDFMIIAIVKRENTGSKHCIVAPNAGYDWNFSVQDDDSLLFKAHDGTSRETLWGGPFTSGIYRMVGARYRTTDGLSLFVNRDKVDTNSWTGTPNGKSDAFTLGSKYTGGDQLMYGVIDEFHVYIPALSDSDYQAIFDAYNDAGEGF